MSSFSNPHFIYLFDLKNGGKKLLYGKDPHDALEVVKLRLTCEEQEKIIEKSYTKISRHDVHKYVSMLR